LVGVDQAAKAMGEVLPHDPLAARIEALRKKQTELKEARMRLSLDLRNAERKKKRLRARARQLTDGDLVAVMMMRKTQCQARKSRGEAASSSMAGVTPSAATAPGQEQGTSEAPEE
jgi:ABC-type uncharacterized transport system substrate-binding protein